LTGFTVLAVSFRYTHISGPGEKKCDQFGLSLRRTSQAVGRGARAALRHRAISAKFAACLLVTLAVMAPIRATAGRVSLQMAGRALICLKVNDANATSTSFDVPAGPTRDFDLSRQIVTGI
jgi:hypothetical protein